MIDELLKTALQHHQTGDVTRARAIYRKILRQSPTHPEALHLSGLIAYQTDKPEEAATLIGRAIRFARPPSSIMHFNLGNVLRAQGREDEALESYRLSLTASPLFAQAQELPPGLADQLAAQPANDAGEYIRRGLAFLAEDHVDKAIACYRRALHVQPDNAEAYNRLGYSFAVQEKREEAIECYRRAIMLRPDYADAYANQGNIFLCWSQFDDALACYREQLRLEPDNPVARHMVDSLSGSQPDGAPLSYVQQLFDCEAQHFDVHLQETLGYDVPAQMRTFIEQRFGPPAAQWTILDLGCGTGLAGMAIGAYAHHLTGVDLSANMLARARNREVYQRLEQTDLLSMMQAEPAASYDAILAADVLIYLGRLDDIVAQMRRLLRPGGFCLFSLEALRPPQTEAEDFRLHNTGRYTHGKPYITRQAENHAFADCRVSDITIRQERGEPVAGYLVLLHAPPVEGN